MFGSDRRAYNEGLFIEAENVLQAALDATKRGPTQPALEAARYRGQAEAYAQAISVLQSIKRLLK